ncbi:PGPGW domain-containing protein [Kitasatospora sp. NPDC057015]|uniref:PGPGW domain-containing protein n=1 Tax=Kitasatospora sp. NPDC057015 TaxID=3346001 RepID=UPI0036291E31
MGEQRQPGVEAPAKTDHPVTRVVLAVSGAVLVLVGVLLLVLPGPGLLLVLAGLILLSRAVPALARYVEPVRARAMQGAEASVASPWRIAGSTLAGLGLIGAGVAWGLLPRLPYSGWSTGSSLILSGVVLLALLVWSYRRVHGARGEAPSGG